MEWEQLLSLKRFGDRHKRLRKEQVETRLGFEVDYDRVIFSAAFRSLQDKTQVIPMSGTDFVHTRLTHSLEVSVVGRSLGRLAGQELLRKHPYLGEIHGYGFNDFGAIVAAAALAHDIGNPPFGHSGEKAIGSFFDTGPGRQYESLLSKKEFQDLIDFEGNANGFRLLTASRDGVEGGLRLSYATLGAFMKYPKESLPKKPTKRVGDKKFGVFQSQKDFLTETCEELGMTPISREASSYARHPLAFLVEAADDICYTIIDFEDGINLGLIPEDYALEYLIRLVKDTIQTDKYHSIMQRADRLGYLRALAINTLINDVSKLFMTFEEDILKGNFHVPLLDKSTFKTEIADIIRLSKDRMYFSPEVVEKEIAGYRILSDILEVYAGAMIRQVKGKATSYDGLILRTLPDDYRQMTLSTYGLLLQASCFVASLSDRAAVHIHNKITGGNL